MIGDWAIRHLPRCTHHIFLSHCAEDRERLVVPVFNALENARFLPWLDQHHYPAGQGAFEALREGILHCRHVVYFVTSRFLSQGRGWSSVENAYANLLQDNLHYQFFRVVPRPISPVVSTARPHDPPEIRLGAARSPRPSLSPRSCRQSSCVLGD